MARKQWVPNVSVIRRFHCNWCQIIHMLIDVICYVLLFMCQQVNHPSYQMQTQKGEPLVLRTLIGPAMSTDGLVTNDNKIFMYNNYIEAL